MNILNKDIYIISLGTFYAGASVTILEIHGTRRKVRVNHSEFFVDADLISTSDKV